MPNDLDVVATWGTARGNTSVAPSDAIELLELSPTVNRPDSLREILASLPATQRLRFLLRIVARASEPFDDATKKAIAKAADSLPPGLAIEWCNWFSNGSQQAGLPSIAALLRNMPPRGESPQTPSPGDRGIPTGTTAVADDLALRSIALFRRHAPAAANTDGVAIPLSGDFFLIH